MTITVQAQELEADPLIKKDEQSLKYNMQNPHDVIIISCTYTTRCNCSYSHNHNHDLMTIKTTTSNYKSSAHILIKGRGELLMGRG